MRSVFLILVGVSILAGSMGGGCLPITDEVQSPIPGTTLSVTVQSPSADRTVPQGTRVNVSYLATNLSGANAFVTVVAEKRENLAATTLVNNLPVSGVGAPNSVEWDTSGFASGEYSIRAQISNGSQTRTASSTGKITIDAPPTFRFTGPTTDVTYRRNGTTPINFTSTDAEGGGTIRIGLDPDLDHGSGNEVFINSRDLPMNTVAATLDWNGQDTNNTSVPANTYNLFALIEDPSNPLVTAEGLARFIVQDPTDEDRPVTLGIRKPNTNVEVVAGGPNLEIEFGVNDSVDVLVDLRVDSDDNHANGNEITILSQRLVTSGTQTDTFSWNGNDISNTSVPDGIYTLLVVSNRGSGNPSTAAGTNSVFRRSATIVGESQQTWERSGASWSILQPSASPIGRRDAAAAFDATAALTVLFGGRIGGAPDAETWVYNRTTWSKRDVPGPPALFGHAMTYDSAQSLVVLFGGSTAVGAIGDTWTWDGSAWTRESVTGPSPRTGHAMTFDATRDVSVLFGGTDGTTANAETWEYDGDTWTLRTPTTSPSARRGHSMVFDTARGAIVMFGGTNGSVGSNETWEWNGDNWTLQSSPTSPPARDGAAMTFDSAGRRCVLFGGSAGVPVISLLTPSAAATTVDPGQFVNISWRDEDPTGVATIRIHVDDDANPQEGTETNRAELDILTGRLATPDGVQDTFSWAVPASLTPGTYFIFAYIDRDGMAPFDSRSIAPGRIIVRDPTMTN